MEQNSPNDESVPRFLNVPRVPRQTLERNYLKSVVCELKFPTLIEVDRTAIDAFRKVIRKTLPVYDAPQEVKFSPMGPTAPEVVHQFQTKGRDWLFTFKPDALVLESSRYRSYDDLERLLREILIHAAPIIDADFFTRVGLRYINGIPIFKTGYYRELAEWINPALVGGMAQGVFGTVAHYVGDVRGKVPEGWYRLRHGLQMGQATKGKPDYMLDFDFYAESVDIADVFTKLPAFADHVFSFFMWSLGIKARQWLLAPSTKPE